jgi:nitrilase
MRKMKIKVGVVQEGPIFFDKRKTFEKLNNITKEYARAGCQLVVFPESFIPGYPRGFDFGAKVGHRTLQGKRLYAKYREESIDLETEDKDFLEGVAKENKTYLVIGVTEKNNTNGSLYCSMLYISPENGLLGVHRKIKPTGTERVVWAEADGKALVTFNTKIGKLGGLICWENYMPLARMSMYQKGVEIYIAPTADSREDWISTMKHIALEGRCFVLGCNQYYRKDMYPAAYQEYVNEVKNNFCEGGSIIVSPFGKVLAGPVYGESKVLMAELDLDEVPQSKLDFDVNGHYSRPDIFNFKVNDQPGAINE